MHNRQTSLRMSDLVKMIFGAFLNGGQIAKVPPQSSCLHDISWDMQQVQWATADTEEA